MTTNDKHSFTEQEQPRLYPIKNGWAASGNGWEVHAATQEEALAKFYEQQQLHEKIAQQPYWAERLRQLEQEAH